MNGTETPQERSDARTYESIKPDAASAIAAGGGDEYASIHGPKQWEVPKRNVRLDKTLGSGHFGKVMKGFLKTKQGTQVVAVKMLKGWYAEQFTHKPCRISHAVIKTVSFENGHL